MATEVSCPSCQARLRIADEFAGRKVKCPKCGGIIEAPPSEQDVAVTAEPLPSPPPRRDFDEPDEPRRGAGLPRRDDDDAARGFPPRKKLGSLAQAARAKHLKTLRIVLVLVGLLYVGFSIFMLATLKEQVNRIIQAEVAKGGAGFRPDPVAVREAEEYLIRINTLMQAGQLALGVLYLVFAFLVGAYPLPIAIISLVLFVAANAIFIVIEPSNIYRGLILKAIVLIAMVKALQAALAYQKERAAESRWREEQEEGYEPG